MDQTAHPARAARFGVFEADLRSGELRKSGVRIKLQEQPFQVLAMLLERPGEVVTREDLRKRLWPEDTFVDFDHSVSTAINKIRDALGDSAEGPRYVETLPRRGYRFIAPVETVAPVSPPAKAVASGEAVVAPVSSPAKAVAPGEAVVAPVSPPAKAVAPGEAAVAPVSSPASAVASGEAAVAPVSPPASSVPPVYDRRTDESARRAAMGTSPLQNAAAPVPTVESQSTTTGHFIRRAVTAMAEGVEAEHRAHQRWRRVAGLGLAFAGLVVVSSLLVNFNVAGLRDRLSRRVGAVREPPLQIHSIAVLPLENLSHDPEQEYFADGMTSELITNLGKVSSLRVISHQSVKRYKGSAKPLPEIARELNVDAVVEGSVLRSGNRVRMTANLLHAPTDRHLWAQTYESEMQDVLILQGELARTIVNEIRAQIAPQEQARLSPTRPLNPKAYEAFLRANFHASKLTPQGMEKAFEHLHRAIAEDPGYAPAYAALADVSLHCVSSRGAGRRFAEARAAALKAVELDDSLAEAHVSLASVMYEECNWSGVESELKRALELNPGLPRVHGAYARYLGLKGDIQSALAELNKAAELNPLSPSAIMAVAGPYMATRQFDRAIYYKEKALELDPNLGLAHHQLGLIYMYQGRYQEGIAEVQKAISLGFQHSYTRSALLTGYAKTGQRAKALSILRQLKEESKDGGTVSAMLVAMAQVDLENKDEAFAWLEKAFRLPGSCAFRVEAFSPLTPEFDPLRSEPRFQDLLRRVNFPP